MFVEVDEYPDRAIKTFVPVTSHAWGQFGLNGIESRKCTETPSYAPASR